MKNFDVFDEGIYGMLEFRYTYPSWKADNSSSYQTASFKFVREAKDSPIRIFVSEDVQDKTFGITPSGYKNQAYELAGVLRMLALLMKSKDDISLPYVEVLSGVVKNNAASYKKDWGIQFNVSNYGFTEEMLKGLRALSFNAREFFVYSEVLGLNVATISDVEKMIDYFRNILIEKLEWNNTKFTNTDTEELIKALGIPKLSHFDDGTKTGRNIYGNNGALDKYSDLSEIRDYLKNNMNKPVVDNTYEVSWDDLENLPFCVDNSNYHGKLFSDNARNCIEVFLDFDLYVFEYVGSRNSAIKELGSCLYAVKIPEWAENIPAYAFSELYGIRKVCLPESIKVINNRAFENCICLDEINFPSGLKSIGKGAFLNCKCLKQAFLPDAVMELEPYAFAGCDKLNSVSLSAGITSIPERAFSYCTGLKFVHFPKTLKEISSYAFFNCTGLRRLCLPDSVTFIDDYAFINCLSLKDISAPYGMKIFTSLDKLCEEKSNRLIEDNAFEIGEVTEDPMSNEKIAEAVGTPVMRKRGR
jgi:hypothetical protein